jgi:hypothetical protein
MHARAIRRRIPKRSALSPRQEAVVEKMAQGWSLIEVISFGYSLVKEERVETVSRATVHALEKHRQIMPDERHWWRSQTSGVLMLRWYRLAPVTTQHRRNQVCTGSFPVSAPCS